jgi:hypothetical protein
MRTRRRSGPEDPLPGSLRMNLDCFEQQEGDRCDHRGQEARGHGLELHALLVLVGAPEAQAGSPGCRTISTIERINSTEPKVIRA